VQHHLDDDPGAIAMRVESGLVPASALELGLGLFVIEKAARVERNRVANSVQEFDVPMSTLRTATIHGLRGSIPTDDRRYAGDDQVPVTSPTFTSTSIAQAADITATDDASNTQFPIELCVFSGQLERLMDAAKPSYCKWRDIGHSRGENQPGIDLGARLNRQYP
jgi:hypothetical protein